MSSDTALLMTIRNTGISTSLHCHYCTGPSYCPANYFSRTRRFVNEGTKHDYAGNKGPLRCALVKSNQIMLYKINKTKR